MAVVEFALIEGCHRMERRCRCTPGRSVAGWRKARRQRPCLWSRRKRDSRRKLYTSTERQDHYYCSAMAALAEDETCRSSIFFSSPSASSCSNVNQIIFRAKADLGRDTASFLEDRPATKCLTKMSLTILLLSEKEALTAILDAASFVRKGVCIQRCWW